MAKSSKCPGAVSVPLYPVVSLGRSISVFTPKPNWAKVSLYILNASDSKASGELYL